MKLKILFIISLLYTTLTAHATLVIGNLDRTDDGPFSVGQATPFASYDIAAGFTTNGTNATLNSVTLSLNTSPNPTTSLVISIFDNDTGDPGSLLTNGTLSGPATPSVAGRYTYTATDLSLSANTTYWIVASAADPGEYLWNHTDQTYTTETWTDFGTRSMMNSSTWAGADEYNMMYAVDVTPVPEPSTYAAIMSVFVLALTFTRRRKL